MSAPRPRWGSIRLALRRVVILIWQATSGSGTGIYMKREVGWSVAAAGATSRATAGRRFVTSAGPAAAATVLASASPGLFSLALEPLDPWPSARSGEKGAE
jgi:hypothetical protein